MGPLRCFPASPIPHQSWAPRLAEHVGSLWNFLVGGEHIQLVVGREPSQRPSVRRKGSCCDKADCSASSHETCQDCTGCLKRLGLTGSTPAEDRADAQFLAKVGHHTVSLHGPNTVCSVHNRIGEHRTSAGSHPNFSGLLEVHEVLLHQALLHIACKGLGHWVPTLQSRLGPRGANTGHRTSNDSYAVVPSWTPSLAAAIHPLVSGSTVLLRSRRRQLLPFELICCAPLPTATGRLAKGLRGAMPRHGWETHCSSPGHPSCCSQLCPLGPCNNQICYPHNGDSLLPEELIGGHSLLPPKWRQGPLRSQILESARPRETGRMAEQSAVVNCTRVLVRECPKVHGTGGRSEWLPP